MKKWLAGAVVLLLFALAAVACGQNEKAQSSEVTVKVERVIDGDTFEIKLNGKKERVRMIGIDTPETKKPNTPVMFYGKEASDFTKKMLEHKTVRLEWDVERRDRYQRLLAYVWIDGEMFNRTLLREGYARLSTYPPNVTSLDRFKKDQEEARKKGKGVWKNYEKAFGVPPEGK